MTDLFVRSGVAAGLASIVLALAGIAHAAPWGSAWQPELTAVVLYSDGQSCDARVIRIDDYREGEGECMLQVVGSCGMNLHECLESYSYVGQSEEPADTLGCENARRPRVLVVDCVDVEGVAP